MSDAEPVHDNSWSANLEGPEHAAARERVLAEAVEAVERTAAGYHVNLVTHADHGHPEDYLWAHLRAEFGADLDLAFVDQCGCGGYVTRAHVG
jgi:putative CGCGG family rSAM target protein